jgi:hypothetical protein
LKKILLFFALLVFIFLLINQLAVNTYDGATFSNSKEMSKKMRYFMYEYLPNKDSVTLLKRKIKSPNLWLEKSQETYHTLVFVTNKRVINSQYNVIIEKEDSCGSNEYLYEMNIDFRVLNCIGGLGSVFATNNYKNEYVVYIQQGSLDSGWVNQIISDSVVYTRQVK